MSVLTAPQKTEGITQDMASTLLKQGYDPTQISLMEEVCLLVDGNDRPIGQTSKLDCHLATNIKAGMLHRAFSIFLFNTEGQLLLQQRADEKITFPAYWTNTCCSHPLVTPDGSELVEDNHLGVRRAAKRKLEHELGISLPLDAFHFITKIHYIGLSDSKWGEHEVDHILIAQVDSKALGHYQINRNEVQSVKFVSKNDLIDMLANAEKSGLKITPWFGLISKDMIYNWWDNLHNLTPFVDNRVHKLGF